MTSSSHPTSFTSPPHCHCPNPGLTICHLGCRNSCLPNQLASYCPLSSHHTARRQSFLMCKSYHPLSYSKPSGVHCAARTNHESILWRHSQPSRCSLNNISYIIFLYSLPPLSSFNKTELPTLNSTCPLPSVPLPHSAVCLLHSLSPIPQA